MADIQSNIQVNIDTAAALANLKNLQRQLANFNASFSKSSAAAVRAQAEFSNNLVNSINATGKFSAGIQEIQSSTERFTQSLEKNKFSTREYFRYAAGSTKAFSKIFSSEFNTIQKVAEERVKDLQTQYIKMGRGANGALKAIAVRPLSLDMEDLATKVAITSQKQQIFGQLLKQGSTNLLNFGKNTQWAGRQLMVGFTIPLTIFGSKAAQVFMDLEMQAVRFRRVYGEMFTTQGETTKALNEVRKLAEEFTKYGVAVTETMKMAADAAAQGKQGADLMAQVAEATRLAVLGQVEQQQALETTMSLQNAFGYSAEQLAGKINFLNAVENQTVVGIEDLTIAIPKAGPVVKQLGGDVEDLAFFLTAMKEGGINASEGANALKSGLASLINPSDKAAGMLEDLGINIKGIVEANKGDIKGTVIGFAQALDTLAPLERSRAIEQLFGKFQFARLSTLFQNVTRDGGQAARTLDLTTKSVEELAIMSERELGAVEDATGTKFKKAMEDLKVAIAPIGEQFLKAVTPIAEFIGKILEKFNGLSDGVKGGISKLVLIVGAVGPVVLMTFGLLANGLANIIKLFAAVRNGFLGLGKNSNYLGNQTNYLTTEQQEAAAIAASLDQAHSKLIQTFTVEQNAVAQLAEVYGQAARAAGRLQASNPGFFMPRGGGSRPGGPQVPGMRLAEGIVSVPGPKGAGDVVPAMLSPGEAVIPAEQNKKYNPLIQGIIADNIPGFMAGSVNVAGRAVGLDFVKRDTDNKVQRLIDEMLREGSGIENALTIVSETLERVANDTRITLGDFTRELDIVTKEVTGKIIPTNVLVASGKKDGRKYSSSIGTTVSEQVGETGDVRLISEADRAEKSANASQKAVSDYYKSIGVSLEGTSEESIRAKSIVDQAGQVHRAHVIEIRDNIDKMFLEAWDPKAWIAQASSLNQLSQVLKSSPDTMQEYLRHLEETTSDQEMVRLIREKLSRGVALEERELEVQKQVLERMLTDKITMSRVSQGFAPQAIGSIAATNYLQANPSRVAGVGTRTSQEIFDATAAVNAKRFRGQANFQPLREETRVVIREREQAVREAERAGRDVVTGFTNGIRDEADSRSPSRKTYRQGQDLVRGMVNGIEDEIKRSRRGRRLASTIVTGAEQEVVESARRGGRTRSGAAGELIPAEKANLPRYERDGIRIVPVGTTAPNVVDNKDEQFRDAQRQQRRTMLARTNGILFGMSTLSSVLGMMGNGVAQKAAPFMVAMNVATMAMQMIQGPWSALAVGVVALVGGIYYLHQKSRETAKKMSQLVDSVSATSQRISEVGKITGKVGASEIMERRRQEQTSDRYTTGFNRAGQQFGTSFLESDVGKNIFNSFQQSLKTNGQTAIKQLGSQLAIYVSQGLMDSEQAESIARAIGVSMSDMTITSKIVGDLRELIGPGGTDLLTDPLEVRVNIITDARQVAKELDAASKIQPDRQVGRMQQAYQAGLRDEKILSATAATNVQNLETVQQQIDSQNKMYDDQIAALKKDKEKTKDKKEQLKIENQINELMLKRKEDEQTIRNQGKEILADQIALFNSAKKARQDDTVQTAIKEQVKTRFKDNPFADALLSETEKLGRGGKKELEVMINTVVGSGIATPQAMVNMITMFGQDTKGLEQTFTALFETQDPGKAMELVNIFNSLGGREGSNKKVLTEIMTKISSKEGAAKFDKRLAALQLLMQMDGKEINVGALIETEDGLARLDALTVDLEKVEQVKTPITKKVITELEGNLGLEEGGLRPLIDDWEEFGKLPEEIKKTAVQTYLSIYRTIGDAERSAFVQKKVAGAGSLRNAEAVGAQAQKASTAEIAFDLFEPIFKALGLDPKGAGAGKKTKKGGDRKATMFDDILKKLKLVQQASVNALKGFKELERVMTAKPKKGGAYMVFDGITNQLVQLSKSAKNFGNSISLDFIDMVEGLSPEELQSKFGQFIQIAKDGTVKITQDVQDLNKAMAAIAAGDIVAGNAKEMKKLEDRTAAVNILRKQGIDYETAMAITESNSLALAIKNKEISKDALDELIKSQQKRNAYEEYYQKIVTTKQQDAVVSQKMANEQMLAFLELQNAIAENAYTIQKTEIEIAAKRNGYMLELINYEEDLINKVYDEQIKALDEIVRRNEEINRLQEGRFSIAEALARGDMAAAARAIQSARQQEIQVQLEAKRKRIEEDRKKTLESITIDGKTRKQIEEENAKNANNLAKINLDLVEKQIAYAAEFTKALGRTPEELKAYNDIAEKMQAIGGFKLDEQSLLKAIKDAVGGNPKALLTSVATVINQQIKDLFGAGAAGVAVNYDENGNPIPKPSASGTGTPDTTQVGLNTTATMDNTKALRELMDKITVGSISAKSQTSKDGLPPGEFPKGGTLEFDDWMFNRDSDGIPDSKKVSSNKKSKKKKTVSGKTKGGKKSGTGSKSNTTQTPQNPRQADGEIKSVISTPDGAWRELPLASRTPVVPKQAIDALPELNRPRTVSGGNIDITVRPNPTDVAATVARIKHEEILAREEKERENQAKATAATQLAAAKANEAAASRYSDAVNRVSPMQAEMQAVFNATVARLERTILVAGRSIDITNNLDERGAAIADVLDNPKIPAQAVAALANEENGALGAVARAQQEYAAKLARESAVSKSTAVLSAEDAKISATEKAQTEARAKAEAELTRQRALGIAGLAFANEEGQANRGASISAQQSAIAAKKQNIATTKANAALTNEDRLYGLGTQLGQIASTAVSKQVVAINKSTKALDSLDKKGAAISSANAAKVAAQAAQPVIGKATTILNNLDRDFTNYNAKVSVATTAKTAAKTAETRAADALFARLGIKLNSGGIVPKYMSMGGIVPKYFASGGYGKGTDIIPAMLTPGEFVIRKSAVDSLGVDAMQSINNGQAPTGNSVYNYSLSVNVSNSNANPNDIARTVINQIKQIDSQRIRSNR